MTTTEPTISVRVVWVGGPLDGDEATGWSVHMPSALGWDTVHAIVTVDSRVGCDSCSYWAPEVFSQRGPCQDCGSMYETHTLTISEAREMQDEAVSVFINDELSWGDKEEDYLFYRIASSAIDALVEREIND